MKIQLLSDLHNECYRGKPPPPIAQSEAEVVVLAGDIDVGLAGLAWARDEAQRLGKRILYVAGNHEFYHHDIALLDKMREFCAGTEGVELLENEARVIDGVRFLACTLWTDYRASGDPVMAMLEVVGGLNDHRLIRHGEDRFLPEDALALHQASRAWLKQQLAEPFDGKTVVISHHGPHLLCQHPAFPFDHFATAFLSDLSVLVEQADLWCFGHTHANLDVQIGRCRLVSNQRGYPGEGVTGFDPARVLMV
ncbi:MAG: metallophosphoesterase [Thiohalomonadaceae bacterium]